MAEEGHLQIHEFTKEVFPQINWMLEDLFCQYGVAMPYFLLEHDFPDYSGRPKWPAPYSFSFPDYSERSEWATGYYYNLDWGEWGYYLPWFNELLGLLFDTANLPRWTMPDFSPTSWEQFNSQVSQLYEQVTWTQEFDETGLVTPNQMQRKGFSSGTGKSCALAWDDYVNDPTWETEDNNWFHWPSCWYAGLIWRTIGSKNYLEFDTLESSLGGTSLLLRFDVTAVASEDCVVYVYNQDWGTGPESSNWTGGTKIGELAITETGSHDITLDTDLIEVGGTIKLRIALKDCEEHNVVAPEGDDQQINYADMQLIWSR